MKASIALIHPDAHSSESVLQVLSSGNKRIATYLYRFTSNPSKCLRWIIGLIARAASSSRRTVFDGSTYILAVLDGSNGRLGIRHRRALSPGEALPSRRPLAALPARGRPCPNWFSRTRAQRARGLDSQSAHPAALPKTVSIFAAGLRRPRCLAEERQALEKRSVRPPTPSPTYVLNRRVDSAR